MDRRIDLTEHSDFRGRHGNLFHLREVSSLYDDTENPFITNEEYEAICLYEKFFGKIRHKNEKATVFGYDKRHARYLNDHCIRCGASIRVPWKRHYDLCTQCSSIVEVQHYGRIPWKRQTASPFRDTKRELFDSK